MTMSEGQYQASQVDPPRPKNGAEALTRAGVEAARAQIAQQPAAPVPQYMTGFEGAASAPFPAESAAVLAAPVDEREVEIRSDGIVYLPGVAYRRILTRAFGAGAWALLPRGPSRERDGLVIYHGALFVLGRFVSEAVGECQTRAGMSYASSLEGARTDCLTRCCKDLGIATELWDPAWREGWLAKYAVKEWRDGKNGERGKWHWSLKAARGDIGARNVGGHDAPKAESARGDGAAGETTSAVSTGSPTTSAETPAADTGEAPTDAEVMELQRAAVALKWKGPRAKNWLRKHFGVETANGLTRQQCADALELLKAAAIDDMDATYGQVFDRLVTDGRVRR